MREYPKLAIILTTFLRDELMMETLKSILDIYQDNWVILVGDQGHPTEAKDKYFKQFDTLDSQCVMYYKLPFDCGLSKARNILVQEAIDMNFEYCLMTADSIKFPFTMVNVNDLLNLFTMMDKTGIMGLNLKNRFPWEWNMELRKGECFYLTRPTDKIELDNGQGVFIKCDMVKNFFLAKTQALKESPWDEELKLSEHEDFFWRMKQTDWVVIWTDAVFAEYIDCKPTEYNLFRKRIYQVYKQKLREKYNITGWVKYEK